jgi:hypothetical protein
LSRPGLFIRARVICQGQGYSSGRGLFIRARGIRQGEGYLSRPGLFVRARGIYLRSGSEVVLGYSRARVEKGIYIYIYIEPEPVSAKRTQRPRPGERRRGLVVQVCIHRCTGPDVAGCGVQKGGSSRDRLAVGGM